MARIGEGLVINGQIGEGARRRYVCRLIDFGGYGLTMDWRRIGQMDEDQELVGWP